MNTIRIIFVERLLFDNDIKGALNNRFKRSGIMVLYYNGYIIRFDKTNVYAISPRNIVFSKYGYNLLVLHYDEYHDDDVFYVDVERYTSHRSKSYIRNYFISKNSNKPTKDTTKNNTKIPKIGL